MGELLEFSDYPSADNNYDDEFNYFQDKRNSFLKRKREIKVEEEDDDNYERRKRFCADDLLTDFDDLYYIHVKDEYSDPVVDFKDEIDLYYGCQDYGFTELKVESMTTPDLIWIKEEEEEEKEETENRPSSHVPYRLTLLPWLTTNRPTKPNVYERSSDAPMPILPSSSSQPLPNYTENDDNYFQPLTCNLDSPLSPDREEEPTVDENQIENTYAPILMSSFLPSIPVPRNFSKPKYPTRRYENIAYKRRRSDKRIIAWKHRNPTNRNFYLSSAGTSSNWLDVSQLRIQSKLYVMIATRDGRILGGHRTRSIFQSIYNLFGRYGDKISHIHLESDHIVLLFESQLARNRVQIELENIVQTKKLDYKLIARPPRLRVPTVYFLTTININRSNQFEWTRRIKMLNNWPRDSLVVWKATTIEAHNMYKISLWINSEVRSLIEEEGGLISLGNRVRVVAVDDFELFRCHQCFSFGHRRYTCNLCRPLCFFCGQFKHLNQCPIKHQPEQWFCLYCRVWGHSIASKECPYLIETYRPELEKYDHDYKFVFLGPDLAREICDRVKRQQSYHQNYHPTVNYRRYYEDSWTY